MARPCKLDSDNPKEREKLKEQFEKLCYMLCTEAEICSFFDVTDKTLSGWCKRVYGCGFSEAYKKYSAGGYISIRRNQLELSKKSAAMAIWLGKQYLGQRDTPIEEQPTESKVDQMTAYLFKEQERQRKEEEAEDEYE